MNWKLIFFVGAVAGGIALAAHRRTQRALAETELWAEATDPVTPFGDA